MPYTAHAHAASVNTPIFTSEKLNIFMSGLQPRPRRFSLACSQRHMFLMEHVPVCARSVSVLRVISLLSFVH